MATAKTGWIADDGKWFNTEAEAVRHEVLAQVWKSFPDLADRKDILEKNLTGLAVTLMPLAQVLTGPPSDSGDTTPEVCLDDDSEDREGRYGEQVVQSAEPGP